MPPEDEKYPYLIHTNRELELMLEGKKPLAVFSHEKVAGWKKSDALGSQDFGPYVLDGTFSEYKKTYSSSQNGAPLTIDYWFYAKAGEEWRFEAYCQLLDLLHHGGWCSHLECLQGTLLGYTEEENRYHLSRKYGGKKCEH